MIEFFRKNLFFNSLLLLLYTLVLRVNTLISPVQRVAAEGDNILYQGLISFISSGVAQSILASILIFLQAVAINNINNRNRLDKQLTLIPGLLYILTVSFISEYNSLSPSLIVVTFLIWSIHEMFQLYKKNHVATNIFNIGFAIGIGTLLLPGVFVYVFFGFIGISILRSFKIITAFQYILGILTPMYLFISFLYWKTDVIYKASDLLSLSFNFGELVNVQKYIILASFLALIILYSLLGYNNNMVKKSAQSQKMIDLMYWGMFFSFLAVGLQPGLLYEHSILLLPFTAVLMSMPFLRIKSPIIRELIHLGALGILFYLHFGSAV